jgi:(p)ppGpp synthase/HD superfamily hydrolase
MTIEETIRIALEAHDGQKDLEGNPAILHVLAVGLMGETELEQKVGFLHDVVEDSDISIDDLRTRGVEEEVLEAVDLLTHKDGITYEEYVRDIFRSGNKAAIQVKINDLHQNGQRMEKTLWSIVNAEKLDTKRLDMYAEIDRRHTWALHFFDSNRGPFPAAC